MPKNFFRSVAVLSGALLITGLLGCDNPATAEKKPHITLSVINEDEKALPISLPPQLPDVSSYTIEAVREKIPSSTPLRASLDKIKAFRFSYFAFLKNDIIKRLKRAQGTNQVRIIVIHEGHFTLKNLYEAIDNPDFLERRGEKYLLKTPLLIREKASLVISGEDATALLLSRSMGAFINNLGFLFIINTRVSGWDDSTQDYAVFKKPDDFRPFIACLNGSETYIAGSTLTHLGFNGGKSYGLTYSTTEYFNHNAPDLPRPTGWVVHSKFKDMYFGFYSFEADDVVIVGNSYANNIVYGIDPHDRSKHLIIAYNEIYGTKKKHGIIFSREVIDSWIFNNYSHHNRGSGIMFDRTCTDNVIAFNISSYNSGDGLTFFESQSNISWGNRLIENGKNGMRLRNSWNIRSYKDEIVGNSEYGIEAYSSGIAGGKIRTLDRDPYTQKAEMTIVKTRLHGNEKGSFQFNDVDYAAFSDIDIAWPLSKTLTGMFKEFQEPFLTALQENKKVIFEVNRGDSK